jgi:hypothetical protein
MGVGRLANKLACNFREIGAIFIVLIGSGRGVLLVMLYLWKSFLVSSNFLLIDPCSLIGAS